MTNFKVSIIMPSFNQAPYIDEAITSILSQEYVNKELIVIDGGSTDGSIEIIKSHAQNLSYWVSETDNGQSAAINKGFSKASGQLLTWSNSDDILLPGSLTRAVKTAKKISDPMQQWIVAGCLWLNSKGTVLRCTRARSWNNSCAEKGLVPVYSPSSFFSRDLIRQLGGLNEDFHYAMDTELWLRFARHGIRYTTNHGYFWGLRLHSKAKTSGHLFQHKSEFEDTMSKRNKESEKINILYNRTKKDGDIAKSIHKVSSLRSTTFWKSKLETLKYRGIHWSNCFKSSYNDQIF